MTNTKGPGSDEKHITGFCTMQQRIKLVAQFSFKEEKLVMLISKPVPEPAEAVPRRAGLFPIGTAWLLLLQECFFQGPFLLLWKTAGALCPLALHAWIFFFVAYFHWEGWTMMKGLFARYCRGCEQNKINGVRSWKKVSLESSPDKGWVCCSTLLTKYMTEMRAHPS